MTTYIVWMLLIVHGDGYNSGNLTIIDNLPSRDVCVALSASMPRGLSASQRCVRVERVKP